MRAGPIAASVMSLAIAGCTTFKVQQSALVPAATLPMLPSERGRLDLQFEDSTVTFLSRPKRAPNSDAGLWITRHLLQGGFSGHLSPNIRLGFSGMAGLWQGAMRAAPTTLANPERTAGGLGPGVSGTFPLGEHDHLHVSLDALLLSIPTRVFSRCVSFCEDVPEVRAGTGRETILQTSFALAATHDVSRTVRLAARVGVRNHPENHEEIENGDGTAEVDHGPIYVIAGFSTDFALNEWLNVVPTLQWPLSRSPVRYGPILSLGVRGTMP